MADKIIKVEIDTAKINKSWLRKGSDGKTYLDVTVLYNQTQNAKKNNGVVVQDVPKEIYQADKNTKGEILGNCIDWATREQGAAPQAAKAKAAVVDDGNLPF